MSDNRRTPGPWKVSASVENDFVGVFPDTGKQEFPICKLPEFIKRDVREANARLIAAAPDLLEALTKLRDADDMGKPDGHNFMGPELRAATEAALSKAQGTQS